MAAIRVGCAVLISKDEKILLGRRGKDPYRDYWVIPGGGIHLFESFMLTAEREMHEETGLKVRVTGVSNIAEIIVPNDEHRLVIYVAAEIIEGEPRPGSDLTDVKFFSKNEVETLSATRKLTPTVEAALYQTGWLVDRSFATSNAVWPTSSSRQIAAC